MINKSRKLSKTRLDVANTGYKIDDKSPVGMLESIRKEIVMGKKLLTLIKKTQIGDNPQVYILCNIIKIWLLLNYLQYIVIEKIFRYAIIVRKNQYSNKS